MEQPPAAPPPDVHGVETRDVAVLPAAADRGELEEAVPVHALSPLARRPDGSARRIVDVVRGITFGSGELGLSAASRRQLEPLVERLRRSGGAYVVELHGHSDASGSDDRNLYLSLLRARAVRDYLRDQLTLPSERIAVVPLGAGQPIADNGTVAGRAQNRRVTVLVLE